MNYLALSFKARSNINRYIWRPLQQLAEVVHPVPPLCAFLLMILLAHNGQLHEIYFSYLEPPASFGKARQFLFAVLALALLSGALFYINYALSTVRIDLIYSQTASYRTDMHLKLVRNIVGLLTAAAPWFGLAWGLEKAASRAGIDFERLRTAVQPFADHLKEVAPQIDAIGTLPARLRIAALLVLVVGVAMLALLHRCRRHQGFRRAGVGGGIAALAGVLILPCLLPGAIGTSGRSLDTRLVDIVPYYRSVGALAMIAMVALSLVAVVAVLSYLSGQVGFPLVPVTLVSVVIATILCWPPQWIAWVACAAFVLLGLLGVLLVIHSEVTRSRLFVIVRHDCTSPFFS